MTGGTVIGREGKMMRALCAAVALAALCALGAGSQAAARGATFQLVDLGDFSSPVHAAEAPGAGNLLFVVQQGGVIRVMKGKQELKRPYLDIRDIVGANGNEEGLLSVAFHPNYEQNRRLYVFLTNNQGDLRIDQFRRRKNDPHRASPGSRAKVIRIDHDQAANHNGGQLQFGPDGMLYAAIGDGGPQQDPENDAQTADNLLGKLIRIDPLGKGGYEVPPTNPYVGVAGADEIYAIGLRNPWRFSFDSDTGALTIGDVGGAAFEEVNYVAAPNAGLGANFGWNDYEGFLETSFGIGPNASPHTEPIAAFSHDAPDDFCAIAGGYVVRDPGLPALGGQYVFSDLCANEIRAIQVPSGAAGTEIGLAGQRVVSFGEGIDGQIYVVDLNGDVYRLEQS